jgi:hypothetical protein
MKTAILTILLGALAFCFAGCSGNDTAKVSNQQEITKFKGNPKSPALQQVLKAGFGAAAPKGAPQPPAGQ